VADRVEVGQVTVPANTASTSPVTQDVSFAAGNVIAVQIVIPDGHAFLTGIGLAQSQAVVIPFAGVGFITGNDETIPFDWSDVLQNGSWQIVAYNIDAFYGHTFYVRFFVNELASTAPAVVASALSTSDIMSAAAAILPAVQPAPVQAVAPVEEPEPNTAEQAPEAPAVTSEPEPATSAELAQVAITPVAVAPLPVAPGPISLSTTEELEQESSPGTSSLAQAEANAEALQE
jgi:hypothetical protein